MARYRLLLIIPLLCLGVLAGCEQPTVANGPGTPPPVADLPGVPQNLAASSGDSQNTITWSPVSGAVSYVLYYSTSPGVTEASSSISGISQASYSHLELTNGTAYYYRVSSANTGGESTLSTEVMSTPHAVSFGLASGIQGTWNKVTEETTNHASGEVTYTLTDSWEFSSASVSRTQLRTDYSDSSEDQTNYYRGSVDYRESDGMLLIVLNETSSDGVSWTTMSDIKSYYRNLVVDGRWHPGAFIRTAAGTGLDGTWESPVMKPSTTEQKYRYSFNTETNMAEFQAYNLDDSGNIASTSGSAVSFDFSWAEPTLTFPAGPVTSPILAGDYLDLPLDGPTPRVFIKQ